MASAVDKKLVDCFWFLQDQCKKDDTCEYRHSQAAHDTQTVCKFWQQSQCTNQACKFRHPSGRTNCMFFAQGKCTKGDACPFQHVAPPGPVDTQLLEKKKKEEEELRKLQAERKKEEERLASLKAKREQLESNKKQPVVERKVAKERKLAVGGTFQRTVGDIVKGVQDKGGRLSNKPQKREIKADLNHGKNSKTPKEPQAKEPSGPVSFGVKSLEQIRKEKTPASNETDAQQPASNSPVQSKDTGYVEELRKKNQQKFAPSLSQKTEQPTKANPSQKAGRPVISPKRQLVEEPTQHVEKRQKKEQSTSVRQSEESVDQNSPDSVEIELDAETLALQELLG